MKITLLIPAICLALSACQTQQTTQEKVGWNYDEATKTLNITGSGVMDSYDIIGDTITTAPWDAVSRQAERIVIADGVTVIGQAAFHFAYEVKEIVFPESVDSIGRYAFTNVSNLTKPVYNSHIFARVNRSIVGHYTVPDGINVISNGAFQNCWELTSVRLPESLEIIGEFAFEGCIAMTSINIPNRVALIGPRAFHHCSRLTEPLYNQYIFVRLHEATAGSYTVPDGICVIASDAFTDCSELRSLTLPESMMTIASDAFDECINLNEIIFKGDVIDHLNIPQHTQIRTL